MLWILEDSPIDSELDNRYASYYTTGMPLARVDVHYPLNGGTMVCSFSLEHAARRFVREERLTTYKIMVNGYVLAQLP